MRIDQGNQRFELPAGMSDREFHAAKIRSWLDGDTSHLEQAISGRMQAIAAREHRLVEELDFAVLQGQNRGTPGVWLLCWLRPRPEHCIQDPKEKAA